MNLINNFQSFNDIDFHSHDFYPYLYTNSNNNNINNPISLSLSSKSNQYKLSRNNYVKKSINLDISPSINNSFNENKKENTSFLRPYSSFSNHNTNINITNENNKKTLILDLDETLVHSAFTPFSQKSDIILNINIEGTNRTLYVLKRPYVDKFLYELSLVYEIFIFTASISQYANPLLDELDKNKYIKYRLFREHCTYNNGIYIKDLKILNRKINNMIIIDNNPLSYNNNIENGIPILSWYDNMKDNELLKLLPLLKYMANSNVKDVRTIIAKIVDRNKSEVDYIAINKILNDNMNLNSEENYVSNEENLKIEKKYRKNNKSQEQTSKIYNKNGFKTNDNNYDYNNRNQKDNPLKNNYIKKYNDEAKINLENNGYLLYDYRNPEKLNNNLNANINIDKMDPYGIRRSIFSPEEYNISINKSFNNLNNFNSNIDDINNNRVLQTNNNNDDKLNLDIKENKRNNYLINNYKSEFYTFTNNKRYDPRSLTPNIDNKKNNNLIINNENYLNSRKIPKKYSLLELTKKALHLNDDGTKKDNDKEYNEYNEYENTSKKNLNLYKNNNEFQKENDLIYNDYI